MGQLKRDHDYGGVSAPQISTLSEIGLFPTRIDLNREPLVGPYDGRFPLQTRARSYLDVNCAHCHGHGGGGTAQIRLQYGLSLQETGLPDGLLTQGDFGIHAARVVVAGDPYRSVLYYRMAKLGPGRMPQIGSHVIDKAGLTLIHDWISAMPRQFRDHAMNGENAVKLRAGQLSAVQELTAVEYPGRTSRINSYRHPVAD